MNWLTDNEGFTEVYVDGCYLDATNTAGYGIFFGPNNPRNYSGRCRKNTTNTEAEIAAVKFGIEHAARLKKQNVSIFSDSRLAVDAVKDFIETRKTRMEFWSKFKRLESPDIKNMNTQELERMVRNLVDLKEKRSTSQKKYSIESLEDTIRKNSRMNIKINWVQAHSGNMYHNEADHLARKGAELLDK